MLLVEFGAVSKYRTREMIAAVCSPSFVVHQSCLGNRHLGAAYKKRHFECSWCWYMCSRHRRRCHRPVEVYVEHISCSRQDRTKKKVVNVYVLFRRRERAWREKSNVEEEVICFIWNLEGKPEEKLQFPEKTLKNRNVGSHHHQHKQPASDTPTHKTNHDAVVTTIS